MPPHGHGHGGHGGGGHHGGDGRGGWRGGGGWPGWYGPAYPDTELVIAAPACPQIYAPVVGSDGLVYGNACLANLAGVSVVRRVAPRALSGITPPPLPVVAGIAAGALVGYLLLRKRKG